MILTLPFFFWGGVTVILDLIFLKGRVTKILNFTLKIKGVVGRVARAKSSDPATPPPQNLERAPTIGFIQFRRKPPISR